ncbi:YhgN family NAAT transporter [uncultured Ferrimonas sp.]|uniref:YhgN family NAAT transporter n=1 Tax=uncultured Ferrimonas sp. TaxID=432640 RepID=UPI00261C5A61|nr:YhgN family NAAT transporter [uncultured Ferrimonas sp.]
METFSAAVMLFLIMDPLGNLPIFMSVLRHVEPKRRRKVLIRELVLALVIMSLFLYTGESLLSFLNLRAESVSIAGGIILFLIAIKMIFPSEGGVMGHDGGQEPFIVPLAIPLIAGPSVLAALLLLSHTDPTRMTDWSIALFAAWAASSAILLFSGVCHRILGERGLIAIERLMGMILVMLSVQMFLDGVAKYLA